MRWRLRAWAAGAAGQVDARGGPGDDQGIRRGTASRGGEGPVLPRRRRARTRVVVVHGSESVVRAMRCDDRADHACMHPLLRAAAAGAGTWRRSEFERALTHVMVARPRPGPGPGHEISGAPPHRPVTEAPCMASSSATWDGDWGSVDPGTCANHPAACGLHTVCARLLYAFRTSDRPAAAMIEPPIGNHKTVGRSYARAVVQTPEAFNVHAHRPFSRSIYCVCPVYVAGTTS